MTLGDLWFIVDVLFWVGFFVLEGFDFGVGMLHSFLGRTDPERRVLVNTIGPVWDGNEVWLIVAGAVIFAAFPGWYATMFSTFYLALVVLLLALMVRGRRLRVPAQVRRPALALHLALGADHRERADPAPRRRRPRRPAARPADRQGAPVHRQLLHPPHALRAVDGRHAAGAVAAHGGHVPDAEDDGRAPRAGSARRHRHRRGWRSS